MEHKETDLISEEIITFGTQIKDGVEKDIQAIFRRTKTGYSIMGTEPFGGKPMKFEPIPEGYKGKSYIHREKNLSAIVINEEATVFRMGTIPTCYYEYKDGWCHGYYDIEKVEEG